jgi:hypothetical protein
MIFLYLAELHKSIVFLIVATQRNGTVIPGMHTSSVTSKTFMRVSSLWSKMYDVKNKMAAV